MSLFLCMMHTSQRFITMSNVKLSGIRSVYQDRIIVKEIARITKANTDWNQQSNKEGNVYKESKNIMDAVYWFIEFLKVEHDLNIINFNN